MYQFTVTLPLPKPRPQPRLATEFLNEEPFRFNEHAIQLILNLLLCVTPWMYRQVKPGLKKLAIAGWQTACWTGVQLKWMLSKPCRAFMQIHTILGKQIVKALGHFARLFGAIFWKCVPWIIFASIYYATAWISPVGIALLVHPALTYMFVLSPIDHIRYDYDDVVRTQMIWGSPTRVGTVLFAFALYAYYLCSRDYHMFLTLGKGGAHQTWNDFKRNTLLSAFGRIDPLTPPSNPSNERGYLGDIPTRRVWNATPWVAGILPQRQLDQCSPPHIYEHLISTVFQITENNISRVVVDESYLEEGKGCFRAQEHRITKPIFRQNGGEIAHPHEVDGSLHVVLHSADIKQVLQKGWGERHPIARASWWWRLFFERYEQRLPVAEHLVLIYAPRARDDVEVIAQIVDAAIDYVAGPRTEADDVAGAEWANSAWT